MVVVFARAADDPALAVDVDPDDAAVLDELEAISIAIEFRSEIIGSAHHWHDAAFELRKRPNGSNELLDGGATPAGSDRVYGNAAASVVILVLILVALGWAFRRR